MFLFLVFRSDQQDTKRDSFGGSKQLECARHDIRLRLQMVLRSNVVWRSGDRHPRLPTASERGQIS